MHFESKFDKCLKGDCSGWKVIGAYFTETNSNGKSSLVMKVNIVGTMSSQIRQTWAFSKSQDGTGGTEVLSSIKEPY